MNAQEQLQDPRPAKWTIHYRIVSLAFLLGIFHELRDHLSSDINFESVASIFAPGTENRRSFWVHVDEFAVKFIKENSQKFEILKKSAEAFELKAIQLIQNYRFIDDAEGDDITNAILRKEFALLARSEVCKFFGLLYHCPKLSRGEVRIPTTISANAVDGHVS